MEHKIGFNSKLYMEKQSKSILERIEKFGGKLYLEFGGKLFDDLHAARVLPGFDANAKIKLLQKLKDTAELILCISAGDIARNKIRADYGITYGSEILRLIDNISALGILINSVVITQFEEQHAAITFKNKLEQLKVKVYIHRKTKGYPNDIDTIVSDEGYGQNPYIETTRPLVVVNAPGPGSGKLATCLSQIFHENKRGIRAGYAKFETFPIWNLPLKHPVNCAYEAATADIKDSNMIDHFHMQAYSRMTVNYNRDIEVFPVVRAIMERISGLTLEYKSPTDMGVNMAGYCITDDEACREAAKQEIIRRYYKSLCDVKTGVGSTETVGRLELIMSELGIRPQERRVIAPALQKEKDTGAPAVCIELPSGQLVTGRRNDILTAPASAVLNAVKLIAGIDDKIKLLSINILTPIMEYKTKALGERDFHLSLDEVLIALSVSAATDPLAKAAYDALPALKCGEAHSTCILSKSDEEILRKLNLNVTSEARYATSDLFNE
ncbi:MAG TPA: DUF1846 domain-containing protein [Eubacteriales bacterium]|jgi:uncharacterized protein (UPF0371 family)|nr:DUF1846 domain-containing protein [Clostridia bacterium]HRR89831.1 DUF1846 domain-containing protein [Eubacteriales bacterium]